MDISYSHTLTYSISAKDIENVAVRVQHLPQPCLVLLHLFYFPPFTLSEGLTRVQTVNQPQFHCLYGRHSTIIELSFQLFYSYDIWFIASNSGSEHSFSEELSIFTYEMLCILVTGHLIELPESMNGRLVRSNTLFSNVVLLAHLIPIEVIPGKAKITHDSELILITEDILAQH